MPFAIFNIANGLLFIRAVARNDLKSARALFSIENCASHSRYFSDELDAQFF